MPDDLRTFLNRLKSLRFIDRDVLDRAFGVDVPDGTWRHFQNDPVAYFLTASDERQAALWPLMTTQYPGDGT